MSYSSQTKEELCRFEPDSVCCLLAELSGIVCAAGSVIYRGGGDKRLSIETENNAVARRAFRLLREVFDVQPQLVTPPPVARGWAAEAHTASRSAQRGLLGAGGCESEMDSGAACRARSRCANADVVSARACFGPVAR